MDLLNKIKIEVEKKKLGSALMLVMFILSGIMIIVFSGSSIVLAGLKIGRIQSESIRAYYNAESGAERLLYEFRKTNLLDKLGSVAPQEDIFASSGLNYGNYYGVNYDQYFPLRFTSIGSNERTRRSVEISF